MDIIDALATFHDWLRLVFRTGQSTRYKSYYGSYRALYLWWGGIECMFDNYRISGEYHSNYLTIQHITWSCKVGISDGGDILCLVDGDHIPLEQLRSRIEPIYYHLEQIMQANCVKVYISEDSACNIVDRHHKKCDLIRHLFFVVSRRIIPIN